MGVDATRHESRLLRACLWSDPDHPREEVTEAAAGVTDWEAALARARRHGLECLLFLQLRRATADPVPPAVLETLRAAYVGNVRRSLVQTMHLLTVVRLLAEAGIEAVPVKGAALAQTAYGDIAARVSCDIDLVLDRHDVIAARDLLVAGGHIPEKPVSRRTDRLQLATECEINLADTRTRAHVELHWQALPPADGAALDGRGLVRRARIITLLDRPVAALAPEDEILYVALHGFKHRWTRLETVYALAQLVRAPSPPDWRVVLERATEGRFRRRLLFGLLLAATVARAPVPTRLRTLAERDDGVRMMVSRHRDGFFAETGAAGAAPDRMSAWQWHRALLDGPGAVAAYAVRRTVLLSHEDWEWIALPRPLTPLYAVLRPVRLSWRYARRLTGRDSAARPDRPPRPSRSDPG